MNKTQLAAEVRDRPQVQITVPNIGTGTMRTTATQIAIQLQLETNCDRVSVLVSAAKAVGMTLEEIIEEWNDKPCPQCGTSLKWHKGGRGCP